MAEYSADKLIIEIDAKVDNAKNKISSLKKELQELSVDKIKLPDLNKLVKSLDTLSKINLANLVGIKNISKINTKGIEKIKEIFADTTNSVNTDGITQVAKEQDKLADSIDNVNKKAKETGKTYKDNGKQVKEEKNSWEKILTSVKRIMFYRLVRTLYQQIENLIKNSLNGLYQISDLIGGSFSSSLDNIKSSFVYLSNSITAMVAPIIETIAPVLTTILDTLAQITNELAKIIAIGFGASEIVQANKELIKFKQNTTSLGIDELNTINNQDDYSSMFEIFANVEEKTSGIASLLQKVADIVVKIVSNENLQTILAKVFDLVFKIIDAIDNSGIEKVLNSVLGLVNSVLNVVVKLLNVVIPIIEPLLEILKPVMTILSQIVDIIALIIDKVSYLFEQLIEPLQPFFELITDFINILFELIGNQLTTSLSVIKNYLSAIITLVNYIVQPIKAIVETIVAIFTGDFNKIGSIWSNLCQKMKDGWEATWKGIGNFFINIANAVIAGFEKFINLMIDGLNAIATPLREVVNFFGGNWQPIGHISFSRIPALATGGIVEDGLFMANQNELIGGFTNGKTAVANNEQITTGIYNAVKDALQESGFGNSNSTQQEIKVYLDSKEIAKQVNKVNKENGVAIYSGATSYAK